MKKLISLILTLALALCLCACGNNSASTEPLTTEKPKRNEIISLDLSTLGEISVIGFDSNKKYSALFYTNYIPIGEEEATESHFYISLFDVEKNRLIKTIELENKQYNSYSVNLNEEGVSLVNDMKGEIIGFDLSLENQTKSSYEFKENWDIAGEIDTIDTAKFDCKRDFALSTSFGKSMAMIFYDEPENIHMLQNNMYYEYRCADEHKVLVVDNSANKTDKLESVIRIFDFDNQREINSIKIENSYDFNNVALVNINNECVTLSTVRQEGQTDKIYVWDYNASAKNTAFENGFCDRFASSEIESKINALCERVKQNLGVELEINSQREFIKEQYEITNDVKPITFYQIALDIEYYLSALPKKLFKEITCADLKDGNAKFDDFRIYLVGDFVDDSVDAFASNIASLETDEKSIVYITYACTGFNLKTFYHEFMHAMEYRIWSFEEDFDDNWLKLNPEGFEYSEDYGSVFYDESHTSWQDYFTRDYGMKNILEDRATCFEELCDAKLDGGGWWREKPGIMAKQKYLVEALEKSFPSISSMNFGELLA